MSDTVIIDEVLSVINEDGILHNCRLRAGNQLTNNKIIGGFDLTNINYYKSRYTNNWHIGGEVFLPNYLNDDQLELYSFTAVANEEDTLESLIFDLDCGVIPKQFLWRTLTAADHD